jgi:U6 snRNA-associated Sm-like protein LSm4
VELKDGVTFNGHLVECDNFMNVTLREVYQTSADGEKFWKMKEMYIKGSVVSDHLLRDCMRIPSARDLFAGDRTDQLRSNTSE